MKVWEVCGRGVDLKHDTNRFNHALIDCKRVANMYEKLQRALEEEWRDNISFWDKSAVLVTSPGVEDWRCGSFGPNSKVCMRLEHHAGRCSDFFSPADNKVVVKLEADRRKVELGEILGQPMPSSSSRKYDLRKLMAILKVKK